ncbi:gamete antigen 27/25 [Plasmodium brasilianum]|uniref:Gamete antigen 27/25 (G27/25) n=2 Tax=Plasmodium (Plasmodium) TaxID=418103 RepID=A0A1A8WID8_PLAMA|nr:gamete antigen 27/25, putative [Plasmodium malariae]KAI4834591.1 gamete antigen 27/25 [Plasmodium brasilianum]SBS92709.1 gamete antigen 27/25 (G27/25) [Plasmodium malariae]SCP03129.1 gamete antigen 27/25, putative [Plasmodium malariae]
MQIFVLSALIKCDAGCMREDESKVEVRKTDTAEDKKYEYEYEHYMNGPPREDVKKWLDVEFHASADVLYHLLPLIKQKVDIFDKIKNTDIVLNTVREFEDKYSFRFIDESAREGCVRRIKGRLLYFLGLEYVTEEYCKKVQKYFWIEERLEEEMSVKMDEAKTFKDKKNVCRNSEEMKRLICTYEKDRNVHLTEDMILHTVCIARAVLLDFLKAQTIVPSKDLPMKPDDDTSPEIPDFNIDFDRGHGCPSFNRR